MVGRPPQRLARNAEVFAQLSLRRQFLPGPQATSPQRALEAVDDLQEQRQGAALVNRFERGRVAWCPRGQRCFLGSFEASGGLKVALPLLRIAV